MTMPYGPDFPLDPDIVADLRKHPGPLPRSFGHFARLLGR